MKRLFFTAVILFFLGCHPEPSTFKKLKSGPIKHHLVVLAKTNASVKVRGFSGATPARTQVYAEVGRVNDRITSNADGSFMLLLNNVDQTVKVAELTFTVTGKPYTEAYDIKDLSYALRSIAKKEMSTDKEIDAIDFVGGKAAILSSQASLVRTFAIDQYFALNNKVDKAILLKPANNVPYFPRSIAGIGSNIIVSLAETHEVGLLDPATERILDTSKVKDNTGQVFRFDIAPPLSVSQPIDADDSGVKNTNIARSVPYQTEALIALNDTDFLASFVNYYQYEFNGLKSVVGPGVIALFTLDNGVIKTKDRKVLPCKNPRYFSLKDDKTVWVTCVGAYANVGTDALTSTDAGLVRLKLAPDNSSFSIEHHIPLSNFTPEEPAVLGRKIVVPRAENNSLAVLDESAAGLFPADIKEEKSHSKRRFTFASHWHDDVFFLGDASGTLVAFSLSEGYFPFPFIEPIPLNINIDEKIGLRPQKIFFRHKVEKYDITTHKEGFNAWVPSAVHHKIFPLDFLAVFGP
jgi:hypothetical protein